MNREEWNYDGEYRKCILVAVAQIVSALVLLGVGEFLLSDFSSVNLTPLTGAKELGVVRLVLYILAAGLLFLAYMLKKTIRSMQEGYVLSFLKGLIRQIHRNNRSSAVSLLIPPSAMCEMCAVFGIVLFIITGGNRVDLYVPVLAGLAMMLILFPTGSEKESLVRLDKEIQQEEA